jgi:hypothetical protein
VGAGWYSASQPVARSSEAEQELIVHGDQGTEAESETWRDQGTNAEACWWQADPGDAPEDPSWRLEEEGLRRAIGCRP